MKLGLMLLLLVLAFSQSSATELKGSSISLPGQSGGEGREIKRVVYLAPLGPATDIEEYPFRLLKLALSYSDKGIGVELSENLMLQERALTQLSQGKTYDVVATMTSVAREQAFLPIRFPIVKGLIGWRLALISRNTPNIFESVTSLEELQKFLSGQVHDWPDTRILKNNGLDVYGVSNFSGLFKMLAQGRIDYFPRAITEIWFELALNKDKPIEVDSHLLIHYPAAAYFFVKKGNNALALEIERGLEEALKDGSLDKLFYEHHQTTLDLSGLKNRRVITLKNTLLPEKTPLSRKELWMPLPTGE